MPVMWRTSGGSSHSLRSAQYLDGYYYSVTVIAADVVRLPSLKWFNWMQCDGCFKLNFIPIGDDAHDVVSVSSLSIRSLSCVLSLFATLCVCVCVDGYVRLPTGKCLERKENTKKGQSEICDIEITRIKHRSNMAQVNETKWRKWADGRSFYTFLR